MIRYLSALLVVAPAIALAQPGPAEPPPPATAPATQPAPPPAYPPPGAPQQPGYPPPQGYPQQPGYGPPPPGYQQPYQPPTSSSLRNGLTFEANLGIGWIHVSNDSSSETSDLGVGGLALGVGGWVSPKLAITARLAGATVFDSAGGADLRITNAFLGGSAQYWIDDHIWLGGGAGLGVYAVRLSADGQSASDSTNGFALDVRAGYTFSQGTDSTWNASFELNPAFYSENSQDATATSISLLLGYQHL